MTDIIIKVLLIMSVLIAFALPGYILKKVNLVRSESTYSLSNILLYVCQAFLVIKSFAINPIAPEKEILTDFGWVALFSFLSMLLTMGVAILFFKKLEKDKKRRDVFVFISTFSNCGFVGIPFIDMFTGGDSKALMFIVIFNAVFNVLVWTLGAYLITQDKKQISLKKAFLNPCSIGTIIGFILFLFPKLNIFNMQSVKELQQIVVNFGSMTAPLSMMIVGIRLAELPIKKLFCDKGVYFSSVMRLLIAPFLTYLIILPFKLSGVFAENTYVLLAPVIAMAMPPAASVVAFAERFDGEKECAAASYAVGTLFAFLSLPIVLAVITL